MAQHDYDINSADAISGLQFRQDVNSCLSAIKSTNSGATAPSNPVAGMLWVDTSVTPNSLKVRNTANDGWVIVPIESVAQTLPSASTTSIGSFGQGDIVDITGTNTITSLGTSTTGSTKTVIFSGALTITHNATSLILQGKANITTVAGDSAVFTCINGALGYWKCLSYTRLSSHPVQQDSSTGAAYIPSGTEAQRPVSPSTGYMRFNTDIGEAEVWNGTAWIDVGGATGSDTGFKNYIINGNFDVWQYGTSQTSYGYGSDDRWTNPNIGSTKTHSQIACTDTERALFNASYFSRTAVASVAGASNFVNKVQKIENVTKLAGKIVTISFWAKADSNKNIAIELTQSFGTGGTPSAVVTSIDPQLVALTSTWQKKTITVTIPSIVGKTLGTDGVHTSYTSITFWFDAGSNSNSRTANLGQQSGTFDIAQVQIEEGTVATLFEQRPYGLELSLCQRYYEEKVQQFDSSYAGSAGQNRMSTVSYKQTKRVVPTVTTSSITYVNSSSIAVLSSNIRGFAPAVTWTAAGRASAEYTWTASAEL